MPKIVEDAIKAIMKSAKVKEGNAIAIAKAKGIIKQSGKHLAAGPSLGKNKGKK